MLEVAQAIPAMPVREQGKPYWFGSDGRPPPALANKPSKAILPRRTTTPIPSMESTSTPGYIPKIKPAGIR